MSNTLVVQNNNTGVDVKRISSREVAEMMEVTHKNLLRKIEEISKTLESSKLSPLKYWIENTYKVEGNKRSYKEYLVSKEGCEFLAHKSTGEKGILFTHRYMERFKEMEQIIEQGSQQIISVEDISKIAAEAAVAAIVPLIDRMIADRVSKALYGKPEIKEEPKVEQISFNVGTIKTPYNVTKISQLAHRGVRTINPILKRKGIISGDAKNGWKLNKKYEEAGWGKTYEGKQHEGTYVKYSEVGMQEILKLL